MTCNTTSLIATLQRASRASPDVTNDRDRAYALLIAATGFLAPGDADTVRDITDRLAREAHAQGGTAHSHAQEKAR